ncbi:hypothetical protein ACFXA3_07615 [Streptomyces sp. NPDC059456]|uniref:hypothetical protein n=1 Tax=Streptomyces sp. NPDC059456 TaxID=3346838 RepID=UPI0036C8D84E
MVEFDVSPASDAVTDVVPRLRRHLATWLGGPSGSGPSEADLTRSGDTLLPAKPPGRELRQASWRVEEGDDTHALRVHLSHPVDSGARFVTQVTVADLADRVLFRVVMGQEIPSGWLSPIQDPPLFRPNVLGVACGDDALSLRTLSQRVTGRFEPIRQIELVSVLAESLASPTRLPTLVMHPRDDDAWQVARRASSQLMGLAQVVTLNYATSQALLHAQPALRVPDGGALLAWPDLSLSHPSYSRAEVTTDGMVGHWMRTLAELSVLARGSDKGWESARHAAQRAAAKRAAAEVEEARRVGDAAAERKALEQRIRVLEDDVSTWEQLAISEAARAAEFSGKAAEAAKHQEEATRWRQLYQQERASQSSALGDPWGAIPDLQTGEAHATYRALEAASEGRIVFTPGAERSWKASRYRFPGEMTEQLVLLAKAAADLYEQPQGSMPHLDEWFSTQHRLRVATSDLTIKNDAGLRWVEFDGERRDTLPHVKVRDGVAHSDCGRIHFALDPKGRRFIVDHVGVKKY